MYERLSRGSSSVLAYRITRPLSREEMHRIAIELEGTIAVSGKIRVLIDLQSFPFADLGGLWEDLKFDVKHIRDLERLALIGGGDVEKWGARIFSALTFTRCRCFGEGELEEAWQWLSED